MPPPQEGPVPSSPPQLLQTGRLYNNLVSGIGFVIAGFAGMLLLTFGIFSVARPANPYADIVAYMILPGVFTLGLSLVPLGMLLKYWYLRRHVPTKGAWHWLRIDMADPATRSGVFIFLGLTFFIVLPVLGVSSYEGYHYTESTTFCGQACHSVMEPQATAHAGSPHARVTCADCHIGSGAGWFVKSKLSGVRQVFAVWFETYSRPIPPAIHQLRPARDTCEECHWPAKFFGSQLKETVHYSQDEANTRRVVRYLVKTGGADEQIGRVEGIHMHMMQSGAIDYIATDDGLQVIPWVQYTRRDGEVIVYRSDGKPSTDPPPPGTLRRVDCMDCHNRGAHHFRSPQVAVDFSLEGKLIDRTLPYIKREAVTAVSQTYPDVPSAEKAIESHLVGFYQRQYPEIWQARESDVRKAVTATQEIYRRDSFPYMKVNWRTYPENIGHMNSPGCFRCHDGLHVNDQGTPIASDCQVCHTFFNPADSDGRTFSEGEFQHSMDLTQHGHLRCTQCHDGGVLPNCRDCHKSGEWLEDRGRGEFRPTR